MYQLGLPRLDNKDYQWQSILGLRRLVVVRYGGGLGSLVWFVCRFAIAVEIPLARGARLEDDLRQSLDPRNSTAEGDTQ